MKKKQIILMVATFVFLLELSRFGNYAYTGIFGGIDRGVSIIELPVSENSVLTDFAAVFQIKDLSHFTYERSDDQYDTRLYVCLITASDEKQTVANYSDGKYFYFKNDGSIEKLKEALATDARDYYAVLDAYFQQNLTMLTKKYPEIPLRSIRKVTSKVSGLTVYTSLSKFRYSMGITRTADNATIYISVTPEGVDFSASDVPLEDQGTVMEQAIEMVKNQI